MQQSRLLDISPELRTGIFEYVVGEPENKNEYTTLQKAFEQQPGLLGTCRQLRCEARTMYFANKKLIIRIRSELARFEALLAASDEGFISSFHGLNFLLSCCGCPEMSYAPQRPPHVVVFDVQPGGGAKWEVIESHGSWSISNRMVFEAMRQKDSFGLQTCNALGAIPVGSFVMAWQTTRFEKTKVLKLIDELCKHPSVASRLQAPAFELQACQKGVISRYLPK